MMFIPLYSHVEQHNMLVLLEFYNPMLTMIDGINGFPNKLCRVPIGYLNDHIYNILGDFDNSNND